MQIAAMKPARATMAPPKKTTTGEWWSMGPSLAVYRFGPSDCWILSNRTTCPTRSQIIDVYGDIHSQLPYWANSYNTAINYMQAVHPLLGLLVFLSTPYISKYVTIQTATAHLYQHTLWSAHVTSTVHVTDIAAAIGHVDHGQSKHFLCL